MKLRNKRTGEIYDFKITPDYDDVMSGWKIENKDFGVRYYSHLAELNSEWEDVPEEPKEYWIIDTILHEIRSLPYKNNEEDKRYEQWLEERGLKFETKEEAELAVRKLKAWKRLKDKGVRFCGGDDACISYEADIENWSMQDLQDFDFLFSGEDD